MENGTNMALEVKKTIKNVAESKFGIPFEIRKLSGEVRVIIHAGEVDIISDGTLGTVAIPMGGRGVLLDSEVGLLLDEYDGTNLEDSGASFDWVKITDDGVAPPATLKLMAIGDSQTDNASSGTTTGDRPTNGSVSINYKGYWVSSAYVQCASDYIFRTDMGKAGAGTSNLLSRLPDIMLRDADVVMLMIGVNDVGGGDIETTKSNYTQIVNGLRANDKFQVVIVPVMHRNDGANPASDNAFIDELNAHAATLAATTDGVSIVPVNTAFDTLMMQAGYGGVSDDWLHTNNAGGMLLGAPIAVHLDAHHPSAMPEKFNLTTRDFVGNGGNVTGGGTGVAPDGYTGTLANNTTEDGFSEAFDRKGDGRLWWKIRTHGGTPVSSNNKSKLTFNNVPIADGIYGAKLTVEVETPHVLSKMRLAINSSDGTYTYSDITASGSCVDAFEAGKEYPLRSATALAKAGNINFYFETTQVQGDDAIIWITGAEVYKVEDL